MSKTVATVSVHFADGYKPLTFKIDSNENYLDSISAFVRRYQLDQQIYKKIEQEISDKMQIVHKHDPKQALKQSISTQNNFSSKVKTIGQCSKQIHSTGDKVSSELGPSHQCLSPFDKLRDDNRILPTSFGSLKSKQNLLQTFRVKIDKNDHQIQILDQGKHDFPPIQFGTAINFNQNHFEKHRKTQFGSNQNLFDQNYPIFKKLKDKKRARSINIQPISKIVDCDQSVLTFAKAKNGKNYKIGCQFKQL